jgi:hypothetical protein
MTPAELAVGRRFAKALATLDANAALAMEHGPIDLRLPCVVPRGRAGSRRLLARWALADEPPAGSDQVDLDEPVERCLGVVEGQGGQTRGAAQINLLPQHRDRASQAPRGGRESLVAGERPAARFGRRGERPNP